MPDNQYIRSRQLPTLPDFHMGEQHPLLIINCLRRRFAHPLETGCPSGMQASEKTAAYAKTTSCAFWLSNHDPSSIKFLKLAEPLSATTIVIAGRHGQERISLLMLLPSEPLSCTMPSSSVCHANPLHVIMGVYMPHRQQPSQGHAISRGKSMTRHIGCLFQRRL